MGTERRDTRDTTGVTHGHPSRRNRRTSPHVSGAAVGRKVAAAGRGVLPWFLGVAAFAGSILGAHYGWEALCSSPRLAVRTIEVRGNDRVRLHEVRAYTGIEIGSSILRADLDAAALSLRRHPWIDTVRLARQLPDRIVVELTEHTPAIVVALGDLYLANERGEPFKRLTAADGVVLPVLTGLGRQEAAEQAGTTSARVREGLALFRAVSRDGPSLGRVDEVHLDLDLGWSVVTRPEGGGALVVHLGEQPGERIGAAVKARRLCEERELNPTEIWADGVKHPERLHVRLGASGNANEPNPMIATAR